MTVKTGITWTGTIVTLDATGALSAATVGPVGQLRINGVINGAAVAIGGANPYSWSVVLPVLAAGDRVSMYITATVALIATGSVVAEESADTSLNSDPVTLAATQPAITWAAQTITSAAGNALTISSTGANGDGVQISGNGAGAGIDVDGGATGIGLDITAATRPGINVLAAPRNWEGAVEINATTGRGLNIESPDLMMAIALNGQLDITGEETAIQLCSTDGQVINIDANGAGTGVRISTGAGGKGIELNASGNAVDISSTVGDGIEITAGARGMEVVGATGDIVSDITGNLSGSVGSVALNGITSASLDATAVDEITTDVWAESLPAAYAAGTAGYILGNLVATITASAAFLAAIAGAVWSWATRTLTSWANLTGSIRTLATQAMSLQFCRGESKVVSIALQYSGGGAFDITGYDVYWALSQKRGSVALLSKSTVAGSITVISAPQGSITFTISVAESWALAAENYVHEVHIRQQVAPRAEHCALHGAVQVSDSTIGIIP